METVRRQYDTNVIGLMEVTKALLSHFRVSRAGMVINVWSMGGKVTFSLAPFGVQVKIIEPGDVATDFGGRSFDFSNDESLVEYQPIVQALGAATAAADPSGRGEAAGVAEVIFQAATDGTDQLRYVYGADAEQIIAARKASDDATFLGGIRAQFGL